MQQEDYLKRQIELMGKILGKIFFSSLGFKTNGDVTHKLENITKQLKSELDLDVEELLSKPFENFTALIMSDVKWNDDNLGKFADILLQMAEIIDYRENLQIKKIHLLKFSLSILEFINERSLIYSYDRNSKIEKITKLIGSR